MADRSYLFLELTNSICATCLRKVEAKVIREDKNVYLLKRCSHHGTEKVLISTDAEYYMKTRSFLKPGQMPKRFNTPIQYGCPYDCGLCPDHEQHSCLTIVEITDSCNLKCPVCYAESGPDRQTYRTLDQIKGMLDRVVENEGEPDVVQISGGEPTIHPEFHEVLRYAKTLPIKHLMVNTNGIRIANDKEFARSLTEFMPGFELYLQFDSFERDPLMKLRGADLREIRKKAIENLEEYQISTTLVVTVQKGLNDGELGKIIDYALTKKCIRGVTFQPIQAAGRLDDYNPARDRLTLSEVRTKIIDQQSIFTEKDIIPVPCHPDCLAMGYAFKEKGGAKALTGLFSEELLLQSEGSTIVFEKNPEIRREFLKVYSTGHSPESAGQALKQLLCCLPQVVAPTCVSYENVFRILIVQFLDRHYFDVRSVKKSCIHIVHPDGRIIPFDTYNLFYRDGKEDYLKKLQKETEIYQECGCE